MGGSLQRGLISIGVPDTTVKYFFQTAQDKEILDQLKKSTNYDFTQFYQGENSLMLAVRRNHYEIANYIINNCENGQLHSLMEDKNQYGDTALMIATINQNVKIAQLLVMNDAKINAKENGGSSVFMAGCASGNLELVTYLFSVSGVNVYLKNNEGQTALHRACYYGEIEIVRFLLKNTKLSILTKDKLGNNCFHLASKHLNMTLIRYMLKKFKKGTTVLQIQNGANKSTIQLLCELFNQIKEESYTMVEEAQMLEYISNKDMPPAINLWTTKQREIRQKMTQTKILNNQKKKKTFVQRLNLR